MILVRLAAVVAGCGTLGLCLAVAGALHAGRTARDWWQA
jgi:hypothetical protein